MTKSKEEWMKVKELDPTDEQANDFFKALEQNKQGKPKIAKPKQ